MNDSQLPAEISPKHSRTQGERDETGGGRVGKELGGAIGMVVVVMMKKMQMCWILNYTELEGNILYIEVF